MKIAISLILICFAGGCTITSDMRQQALDADKVLKKYRAAEQSSLDQYNKQYRQIYHQLVKQQAQLGLQKNLQRFDQDALEMSDSLIGGWQGITLAAKFRDSFYGTVSNEMVEINKTEQDLETARTNYANAYQQIDLTIQKLATVDSALQKLSAKPGNTQELNAVLQVLYEAYETNNAASSKK